LQKDGALSFVSAYFTIYAYDALTLGNRLEPYGGIDPEMIEGDMFRIIVKVPEFESPDKTAATPQVGAQVWAQVEAQVGTQSGAQPAQVIAALLNAPLSMSELVTTLGLKTRTGSLKRVVNELLTSEFIAYSIPDKPNSRLQKYRLTDAGKRLLASMPDKAE